MNDTVPARPSATVAVLRDADGPPELLMVKRRAGDAFGDSYAFPGGVVDHDESDAHGRIEGRSADDAARILDVGTDALDYYSAAIRELFEETGILLARSGDGHWADPSPQLAELRVEVDRGRLPWSIFLESQDLRLACDALHYFAHWETPLARPKRWSTRFFLAELPQGQHASCDGTEVTDIRWLTAGAALASARDGSMKLPIPTTRNLMNLSAFGSIGELKDWADEQVRGGVTRLCPIQISENGKRRWVVWGDPGYPHNEPM